MGTLRDRLLAAIRETPGLTDRELTDRLLGSSSPQQGVNQLARALVTVGAVQRIQRSDGKLGNFPSGDAPFISEVKREASESHNTQGLTEDQVKRAVSDWLSAEGWATDVKWGREPGIDIVAQRSGERWVIEAKGCGSLNAMRVNYFLSMLGETLQRMDDPKARYSIALPDMQQFRRLWSRLPALAKSRTGITAIFVEGDGTIVHLD